MRGPHLAVAATLCAALLAGCVPAPATSASPSAPAASPSAALDLTAPGEAKAMIRRLVAASGSTSVIMVSVKRREASVSVLVDGKPQTWAYRGGALAQVSSDLAYVDQASFDPGAFDLSDVGALFRAAAAVSGSESEQELQIVDLRRVEHSALEMPMSVATNPETRTVFFAADGSLIPVLDFGTQAGIAQGLADAVGSHPTATGLAVGSAAGASIDYVGPDGATTVRRMRAARIPVTDVPRPGTTKATPFDPRLVKADVIWRVLQRADVAPTTVWSMTADAQGPAPRLRFTIAGVRSVTDLAGNEVTE